MTDQHFNAVRKLLLERTAIALDADKEYLVESRLTPLLRELNFDSIGALVEKALATFDPAGNGICRRIVEAMVTTETSFFRDLHPFETLRKQIIPDLIERRRADRRLSFWCAASASGQEPYSLAMLIRDHFPNLAGWQVSILATDISREMLVRAKDGRYSQLEVNRGLPAAMLIKHFQQNGSQWQLHAGIRAMVDFQEMNLASAWPPLGPFDVVMIRNVMIYFDVDMKRSILRRIAKLMHADSYLLLGGAETTIDLADLYCRIEPLKSGFHQLTATGASNSQQTRWLPAAL